MCSHNSNRATTFLVLVQSWTNELNWNNYRSRWFFKEWRQHRNETVMPESPETWKPYLHHSSHAVAVNSPYSLQLSNVKITNHHSTELWARLCVDLPRAAFHWKITLPFLFFLFRLNYLKIILSILSDSAQLMSRLVISKNTLQGQWLRTETDGGIFNQSWFVPHVELRANWMHTNLIKRTSGGKRRAADFCSAASLMAIR